MPGARRIRLWAMCLRVVKLAGACSVRMRHSSSRKIMSITQCRLFSMAQWLRITGPNRDALTAASYDQLARLLGALVRRQRWDEYCWKEALESGLILAVAERAETLLSTDARDVHHAGKIVDEHV